LTSFVLRLLFLLVFALPFALIISFGAIWGGILPLCSQAHDWWEARSYVPVPAQVDSTTLDKRHSKKRGTTYELTASFSYEYQGRHYLGQRAGFNTTANNGDGFQPQLYARLRDAQERRQSVELWVDPRHPERSIYDRTIRKELLALQTVFAFLFSAIGLWTWRFIFRNVRRRDAAPARRAGHVVKN